MHIKEVLLQWFTNFLEKKSAGGAVTCTSKSAIKSKSRLKQQLVTCLAEELHKPIVKKCENC